jgi:hypothetical protein
MRVLITVHLGLSSEKSYDVQATDKTKGRVGERLISETQVLTSSSSSKLRIIELLP